MNHQYVKEIHTEQTSSDTWSEAWRWLWYEIPSARFMIGYVLGSVVTWSIIWFNLS